MERRPAIVAYDIADDRTRRGALRVQLAEVLDPETDRLLLAWLHTRRPVLAVGKGRADGTARPLWHVR